jgi:hypothetical protein
VVGAEREAVRELGGEGRGEVRRVEAWEGVERDGGGVLGYALSHAVQEEADDEVEVAGDEAVREVPDAVAAQAGVRGEQLLGSARGI